MDSSIKNITINHNQARQLIALFGGEDAEYTIFMSDGHRGYGLYAYHSDYPEDGAAFLEE